MAVNVVTVRVCASRTMNNFVQLFSLEELASAQVIVLQQCCQIKKKKKKHAPNVAKPRMEMKISQSQPRVDQVMMSG